ncbi:MAG: hypothetical protein L0G99_06385 [Propionibacteriales bacterium]|nr:hypothetical protein [Propionibacteriales bacterium]
MGWNDWDRTNKVVVSICAVVALAVIATFAVLAFGPKKQTPANPPLPPPTAATRPSSESPTPSPSPTYQCTTASGPDCTKDLADKEAARDKAYADAESTYRTYYTLLVDEWRKGGGNRLPENLKRIANDEVQAAMLNSIKNVKAEGYRFTGTLKFGKTVPSKDSPEWPKGIVVIDSCVDGRGLRILRAKDGSYKSKGSVVVTTARLEKIGGTWKITKHLERSVKSC